MFSVPGAALIRVATYPSGLALPAWPDFISGCTEPWLAWLAEVWALPQFAAVVTSASPQLAARVGRALTGEPILPRRLRRLVESTALYLLRWTTRCTPFGRFAGVAPVGFADHAAVRWGEAHHVVIRPAGQFLAAHSAQAEKDLATLRQVHVVTNCLGYRRGEVWVLPCARTDGDRRWDVEIGLTEPIWTVIRKAEYPIVVAELAARIARSTLTSVGEAEQLVAALVKTGALLSALNPAVTITEPLGYQRGEPTFRAPDEQTTVDLRADVSVTLPTAVLREATHAASALVAVAPHFPAWTEYHDAFIQRWGPATAVPLRDVLTTLGFPAGFRGSHRRSNPGFTARDQLLTQLAQQSALDGCDEVVLDDDLIGNLRGEDDRPPIPHTELRFTIAADTLHDLDRGAFTLTVVSGARHAGASAGRFLHLLRSDELASFQHVYRMLPTSLPSADKVQLSGPPLDNRLTALARTPQLLPILPIAEFHPEPPWTLADLAVTGDGHKLWLISRTTSRPVEPLLFNSVILPTLQQPMMRFLAEIWTAWHAPCSRFDWGHASAMPFLPRMRRGRSILHPARWNIDPSSLPQRNAAWPQWLDAWQRHRYRFRLPREILLGTGEDMGLRLDLEDKAHLALLRSHIDRRSSTVLTEAPGPADWINGRPAEIVLTLAHPPSTARPARRSLPVSMTHRLGNSLWLETRLHGWADAILADLAARPEDHLPGGWWFLRYPNPEPHLRLRIPLRAADQLAAIVSDLARWAEQLEHVGALHDYTLHSYRPQARHGSQRALEAAEAVFAADSHAVLRRLNGDRQAATASGMIAIAEGFTSKGIQWLAEYLPHRSGPRLDPAQVARAGIALHDERLAAALVAYRCLADHDGLDPDLVLADLLHLHHARMVGVDRASERHCLRLARAVARARRETA